MKRRATLQPPHEPRPPAVVLTASHLDEMARTNPTGVGEHPIIQQLLAQRASTDALNQKEEL